MPSKEYLETARVLHRAAQRMTDRMVAGQLSALAEDCERRAEKAAQADAAKVLAGEGPSSLPTKSRARARLQAARAAQLAERTLEKIQDPAAPPQERAQRKHKLTKGPSEFQEDRIDQRNEASRTAIDPPASGQPDEAGNVSYRPKALPD
jgi:hypothetical protein